MPVDNEAPQDTYSTFPETHTVQDIEVDTMHNDPGVHGVHVIQVKGFTLKESIKVAQWLSEARDERILTIRSV